MQFLFRRYQHLHQLSLSYQYHYLLYGNMPILLNSVAHSIQILNFILCMRCQPCYLDLSTLRYRQKAQKVPSCRTKRCISLATDRLNSFSSVCNTPFLTFSFSTESSNTLNGSCAHRPSTVDWKTHWMHTVISPCICESAAGWLSSGVGTQGVSACISISINLLNSLSSIFKTRLRIPVCLWSGKGSHEQNPSSIDSNTHRVQAMMPLFRLAQLFESMLRVRLCRAPRVPTPRSQPKHTILSNMK